MDEVVDEWTDGLIDGKMNKMNEQTKQQVNCLAIIIISSYAPSCRLGGPDPLDFLNIYRNPGDSTKGIPQHWHYVTCGLSDLYGDGRVHE